jgi:hypothetical protein
VSAVSIEGRVCVSHVIAAVVGRIAGVQATRYGCFRDSARVSEALQAARGDTLATDAYQPLIRSSRRHSAPRLMARQARVAPTDVEDAPRLADQIDFAQIDQLLLDSQNPRLTPDLQGATQDKLLQYIEARYEPVVVGRSVAKHGFFISEPLIVIPATSGTRSRRKKYIVVEGNRRLVALKLLTDPKARALVDDEEWAELSRQTSLPERGIPIVVAEDREQVAPIIGYRHIAGIQQWDPYPKARFITHFIDVERLGFSEVAELVGEDESDVRASYRNHGILEQARDVFKLDTDRVERDFGVFDRAVVGAIREFIGAPTPAGVRPREYPLAEDGPTKRNLRDLFSFLFGDSRHRAVIRDSRQLTTLGRAIRSPDGLEVLRQTRDLSQAVEAAAGKRARLISRLNQAQSALRSSKQDLALFADDVDAMRLLDECQAELDELKEIVGG